MTPGGDPVSKGQPDPGENYVLRVLFQTFVLIVIVLIVGSLVHSGIQPSAEPLSLFYATTAANDSLEAGAAVRMMGEQVGVVYSVAPGEAGYQTVAITSVGEREFPWNQILRFEVTSRGIMHREFYVNAIPYGAAGIFEKFRERIDKIVREAYQKRKHEARDTGEAVSE